VASSGQSARELLRRAGVELEAGLSDEEINTVQARFGFRFLPQHRDFLRRHLPTGERWPDWRTCDATQLGGLLRWPVDSALFDVRNEEFWPRTWGSRPEATDEALRIARRHLEAAPMLVPVYAHRYLPAEPAPSPSPVFSVYQTDVIVYGADLDDYLVQEFGGARADPVPRPTVRIPFWSDLAEGAEDDDL
jgi:hypothetical protein